MLGDCELLSSLVPAGSIDYLIDVKSAFFYPDKEAYFREASLVLKEDGYFLLALPQFRTHLEVLHRQLKRYFTIVTEEDLTENAIHTVHLDSDRIQRYIDQAYPIGLRSLVKQIWGVEGTVINTWLASKTLIYKAFVLKKKRGVY